MQTANLLQVPVLGEVKYLHAQKLVEVGAADKKRTANWFKSANVLCD